MSFRAIIVVVLLAGGVGYVAWESVRDSSDSAAMESILKREATRDQVPDSHAGDKIDGALLERLAERGSGQPLPTNFQLELVEGDNPHWSVTVTGSRSEAKLPFTPGQVPTSDVSQDVANPNPGFLGSEACGECHEDRYHTFVDTAHHLTSRRPSIDAIAGDIGDGKARVLTGNPELVFDVAKRGDQFFQQFSFHGWHCEVPIEIVTGTAKMGQSFLYWHEDGLYQANVSFVPNAGGWVNSPGFPDGNATFERPMTARCLECHVTYADYRKPPNHYTRDSMILGLSCERCHGPGAEHVRFHQSNPDSQKPFAISHPAKLDRQQQLDLCGQCHAGLFPLRGKPFSFRPGDALSDHYVEVAEGGNDGVHTADQLERLKRSSCFAQSEMTCIDCHNPHQRETGRVDLFSQRCMRCHESESCGMSETVGVSIRENCIDCHMPMYESNSLTFQDSTGKSALLIRDHHIRIDQNSTQKHLSTSP